MIKGAPTDREPGKPRRCLITIQHPNVQIQHSFAILPPRASPARSQGPQEISQISNVEISYLPSPLAQRRAAPIDHPSRIPMNGAFHKSGLNPMNAKTSRTLGRSWHARSMAQGLRERPEASQGVPRESRNCNDNSRFAARLPFVRPAV